MTTLPGLAQVKEDINGKTLPEIYGSKFPPMAKYVKTTGKRPIIGIIKMNVVLLQNELNLSRQLSQEGVDAVSEDIYQDGYFLSFQEIQAFFGMVRRGKYGSFFEGLNSMKMCEALAKFINDRHNHIERIKSGESNEIKSATMTERSTEAEEQTESIAELTAKMELKNQIENR